MAVPRSSTTELGRSALRRRGPSGVVAGSGSTCNFGRELAIGNPAQGQHDGRFNGRLERISRRARTTPRPLANERNHLGSPPWPSRLLTDSRNVRSCVLNGHERAVSRRPERDLGERAAGVVWRWAARLTGRHDKVRTPPDVRAKTKPNDAAARAIDRMAALPLTRLLVAHSDVIEDRPSEKLLDAWRFVRTGDVS